MLSADRLLGAQGELLEGPYWDAQAEELLVADIARGVVLRVDWRELGVTRTDVAEAVSAVIARRDGGEIWACRSGVYVVAPDGTKQIVRLGSVPKTVRCNDAKCDPTGRLWFGTMADDARPGAGCLYRLEANLRCIAVRAGITISNGLGWSPDGAQMYYVDSPKRRVEAFRYDVERGYPLALSSVIDTNEFPGIPDGLAVDAEGCIWVAFYGGGCVRRFSPKGTVLAVVSLPTPYVTSCAFAGPELDCLIITSAIGPTGESSKGGGDLYVYRAEATGLPVARFAG